MKKTSASRNIDASSQVLDDFASLATQICQTPCAEIHLTARPPRLKKNFRFCFDTALTNRLGSEIGLLRVADYRPRKLKAAQVNGLRILARKVVDEIEHRQTIGELQKAKSALDEAQRLAMIGSWEWRAEDGSLLLSDNQRAILGLSPPQSLDANTFLQPFLAQKIQFSGAFCFERQFTRPDGVDVTLLENGRALFERGRLVRIWGTTQDLTDAKQTQTLMDEHQAMIFASSKLAALGEMAGSIAHEINNPLAIIYAKTWNLKQAAEVERLDKEFLLGELDRIHTTVGRIARIIRGLRAATRASDQELMEPIRMSQVIEDTIELCQARIKDQGIKLAIDCAQDEWVQCRAPQISQILLNLLNNAVDAVDRAKDRWIEIKTEKAKTGIRIMVMDSGPGIPESIRNKIMKPFFTTKANGTGMGLGLSTSRGLAEQNGGKLYLDTQFIHTCFTLELPILEKLGAA